MPLPQLKIGCDPELFVRNTETGQFVSAWGMIPGDKKAPFAVDGGAIQVDGMAVEFNIEAAETRVQWNERISAVQASLAKALPPGHELVIQPVADFDPAYWASLPDEAKVLGCEPDFNAYTKAINPRPDGNPPFRSGAGHVHVGFLKPDEYKKLDDADHIADCIEVVKQLDYLLGIPSMAWDPDMRRRRLYGKAGCYRVKPYGVEYRTPSNMWLTHPKYQSFVYDATKLAVESLFEGTAMRVSCYGLSPQNFLDTGYSKCSRNTLDFIQGWLPEFKNIGVYEVYKTAKAVHKAANKPLEAIKPMAAAAAAPPPDNRWLWQGAAAPRDIRVEVAGAQINRGEPLLGNRVDMDRILADME